MCCSPLFPKRPYYEVEQSGYFTVCKKYRAFSFTVSTRCYMSVSRLNLFLNKRNAGKMKVPADSVKPPSFASLLLWNSLSAVLVLFFG